MKKIKILLILFYVFHIAINSYAGMQLDLVKAKDANGFSLLDDSSTLGLFVEDGG